MNKRQFARAGVEGETFGHLVNASKQSLSSKNLTTTHRQAPRKTTINLGRRRAIDMRCGSNCSPKGEYRGSRLRRSGRFSGVQ